jgi:hypothetical protein
VPPAVALINYISSGKLWQIFCQTGHFAGFSLYIIRFAVYLCTFTQCVFNMHTCLQYNKQLNMKREAMGNSGGGGGALYFLGCRIA